MGTLIDLTVSAFDAARAATATGTIRRGLCLG